MVWLQSGQGYSALDAGLVTVAFSAGGLAMAAFVGRLIVRAGLLLTLAGCLLAGVGALGVLAAARTAPEAVNGWSLVPGLFAPPS
ncbi:hypothetical protein [Streptomyces sp. ME19-01-6]|uniref:hypothetical protein n=1 Tax=Streptomyces sp. ME19-01-6 TaxID=3028686 RepID=UPI0029BAFBDF|nr:hypothetical protein [Streptomyces sp. ME19-01-6]MDX3226162.1 hypothetical protein [Streptomyces sp. ME19-01-6]